MTWSRRRVLKAGGLLAGVSAAGLMAGTAHSQAAPKRIALLNLHTGERLEIEFFRDGAMDLIKSYKGIVDINPGLIGIWAIALPSGRAGAV